MIYRPVCNTNEGKYIRQNPGGRSAWHPAFSGNATTCSWFAEMYRNPSEVKTETRNANSNTNCTNLSPGKRNQLRVIRMALITAVPNTLRKKES